MVPSLGQLIQRGTTCYFEDTQASCGDALMAMNGGLLPTRAWEQHRRHQMAAGDDQSQSQTQSAPPASMPDPKTLQED